MRLWRVRRRFENAFGLLLGQDQGIPQGTPYHRHLLEGNLIWRIHHDGKKFPNERKRETWKTSRMTSQVCEHK
jgi:hypothetical protein